MKKPTKLHISAETTTGAVLFVGEYNMRQYDDMGEYGCLLEARATCKAAGVEFRTMLVEVL